MKTKQKIQRMKQMMLLICCLLPIFSSCSSDESSTVDYTVIYQGYSPRAIDPTIVETILEYQNQQGLINRHISVTTDHAELTDADFEDMAKQVGKQTLSEMAGHDYNQVIRNAGLSVSEPVTLAINYQVGLVGNLGGSVISYGNILLKIDLR